MTSQATRFGCRRQTDRGVLEAVPCIDGVPLTHLMDQFEADAGMQPAGDARAGLVPQFFRFGCECGAWGCPPLMTAITVAPEHVTWDSFEQPHRTARDYTGLGTLRFDRRQYDDAVQVSAATVTHDET